MGNAAAMLRCATALNAKASQSVAVAWLRTAWRCRSAAEQSASRNIRALAKRSYAKRWHCLASHSHAKARHRHAMAKYSLGDGKVKLRLDSAWRCTAGHWRGRARHRSGIGEPREGKEPHSNASAELRTAVAWLCIATAHQSNGGRWHSTAQSSDGIPWLRTAKARLGLAMRWQGMAQLRQWLAQRRHQSRKTTTRRTTQ